MKKYLLSFAAIAALSLLTLSTMTSGSRANDHQSASFFNNYQMLVLSNNVTVTNTTTNVFVLQNTLQPVLVGTNLVYTNVLSGSTNSLGNLLPTWEVDVPITCLANGDVSTNIAFVLMCGSTNVLYQPYQLPPLSWINTNGLFTTNYPVPAVAMTAASTNTITLTFQAIKWGTNVTTDSSANDRFTMTVIGTGLTPVVIATNAPAGFWSGTKAVSLVKIASDNSTSPGIIINDIRLAQWRTGQQ